MAEFYQVASGSKKISNLALIDGISGSAVIPVVMSNIVGSSYPITNGTTNQISYQDFRESVILNNQNTFTIQQSIITTSGKKVTQLTGDGITILTGSALGSATDGFKVDSIGGGVKLYSYDKSGSPQFRTFLTVGTDNGDVTLTKNVLATGNLGVAGNLSINQNLVVGGTITAQSYNTEFISASIIYESGSTKFGDTTDDRHERTGSLLVSGSSAVVGNLSVSGMVQNALLGAVTTSLINQNTSQGLVNNLTQAVTSSLITQNTSQGLVNNLTQAVTSSLITQNTSQGLVNTLTSVVTSSLLAQTASQAGVNLGISIVTASLNAYTASGATSTSNINSFTASQLAVNDLTLAVTSSLITQNTSQGLVNNLTQAVTSSLITQNTSQGAVNLAISGVTASLITQNTSQGLVNNLTQAVTSSLITQNTSQGLVNNLTQAVTASLITQNTSQGLVNTLTSAVTQSLINQNTSQGAVNLTISGVTASLINQNTSQGLVNTLTSAVTTSLINQNTSQGLVNNLTQAVTSSLITIVGGLQSYTASLKGVSIVSSSQQIVELNQIAPIQAYTASLKGAIEVSGQNVNVLGTLTAQQFSVTYVSSSVMYQSGSNKFGDTIDDIHQFTGSLNVSGSIVGSLLSTNGVVSSSNQLIELNNQTGSQNSVNNLTQAVTSSLLTTISGVQAYTSSLKTAFSVSGTTTTHNGIIDTSENLLYSKRTSPANVNSGATTVFTITQKSGEFQSTYMISIVGLYDSGGANQNGFYTGFVTFFTDGAIAQANISAIHSNGWSATAAATTGGSFTVTFTNSAATTMTNIRITALKINAT